MIAPYFFRLASLCLASFFLLHLLLGFAVYLLTPAAIRIAERMRPSSAAQFLFAFRYLPADIALFLVSVFCIPSYLSLEPRHIAEPMGLFCLVAAALSAAVCAASLLRALRALRSSQAYLKACRRSEFRARLGKHSVAFIPDTAAPCFCLAGVFRPRLVISSPVLNVLSPDQFRAALRHEFAHRSSHDNLKRLLLLLAPQIFPAVHVFRALERAWMKFAEWAADDRAAAGSTEHSIFLAEALVHMARLNVRANPMPLTTSLLSDSSDLAVRVARLLSTPRRSNKLSTSILGIAFAVAAALFLAAPILHNTTLASVHALLEHLVH